MSPSFHTEATSTMPSPSKSPGNHCVLADQPPPPMSQCSCTMPAPVERRTVSTFCPFIGQTASRSSSPSWSKSPTAQRLSSPQPPPPSHCDQYANDVPV